MAFKFRSIAQIEHNIYPFEDAVVNKDVLNGAFGTVEDGVFTPSESGKQVIMQVEVGDDAGVDEYKIPAGSHVRVFDTEKNITAGYSQLEVYGYPLPETWNVGDTLGCFTIKEVIGNKAGAVVEVTPAE